MKQESSEIKKILVVSLDNLGDAVMASCLFQPLKEVFPNAKTAFWVKRYTSDLFLNEPLIDQVFASDPFYDKSPGASKGSLKNFFLEWSKIRAEKFDVVIVCNSEWRRALLLQIMMIPTRLGLEQRKSKFFLTNSFALDQRNKHQIQIHLNLLESWIGAQFPLEKNLPSLSCSNDSDREVKDILRSLVPFSGSYAVFHPFTGSVKKDWSWENWQKLATEFSSIHKQQVIFLMSPHDRDRLLSRDPMAQEKIFVSSSLSHMKSLLKNASIFIGADSGPGHVAAALGTKVISLFGPSDPIRYAPKGMKSVIVIKKHELNQISVSEVIEAIKTSEE